MKRNIEIKARIKYFNTMKEKIEKISETPEELIVQYDTFFKVPDGRLKLRSTSLDKGELIYYERDDKRGPTKSTYNTVPVGNTAIMLEILNKTLGAIGEVKKKRLLYTCGHTRIHLDDVEGLGWFVELEVVLFPHQKIDKAVDTAHQLMEKLGIEQKDLVEFAYIDLILDRHN